MPNKQAAVKEETKTDQEKQKVNKEAILLVEDEPLLANLLEKRLDKAGFQVFKASDGKEALDIIEETTPNLVLLDIILPKVSGFEFMEKVRENPKIGNVPIVVISNLGQEGDIEKGKELGAVGYFVKAQLSIEDLVKQIQEFLENKNFG